MIFPLRPAIHLDVYALTRTTRLCIFQKNMGEKRFYARSDLIACHFNPINLEGFSDAVRKIFFNTGEGVSHLIVDKSRQNIGSQFVICARRLKKDTGQKGGKVQEPASRFDDGLGTCLVSG